MARTNNHETESKNECAQAKAIIRRPISERTDREHFKWLGLVVLGNAGIHRPMYNFCGNLDD